MAPLPHKCALQTDHNDYYDDDNTVYDYDDVDDDNDFDDLGNHFQWLLLPIHVQTDGGDQDFDDDHNDDDHNDDDQNDDDQNDVYDDYDDDLDAIDAPIKKSPTTICLCGKSCIAQMVVLIISLIIMIIMNGRAPSKLFS